MMYRLFLSLGGIASFSINAFIVCLWLGGALIWVYNRDLPNTKQLAQYTPPVISRVYSSEGQLIDEFARERRIFIPYDGIPKVVKDAFISAEDKNFYTHTGYDLRSMIAAALQAVQSRGALLRGASTITQQVMKNFLLSNEKSIKRKVQEIILASRIEKTLSKDDILELYLNEIFLGQNSYGVAAAAQTYFNKIPENLSPEEAAYLAALAKAPSNYHPQRHYQRALNRRNFVLREMLENGYLDTTAYDIAQAAPLDTVQTGAYPSFRAALPPRNHFTDEVRRRLSAQFGEAMFFNDGLTIRSTIDSELQKTAALALRQALEKYNRQKRIWYGTNQKIDKDKLMSAPLWQEALRQTNLPNDITEWHRAVVLDINENRAQIGVEGTIDNTIENWIPPQAVRWARPIKKNGKIGKRAQTPGDLLAVGDVIYVAPFNQKEQKDITDDYPHNVRLWSLHQIPKVQGAFVAMDISNGRVLAMQGGFSYQDSVFNRSTQALRQPGSAFKPFVYAAALDSGFTPATIIIDAPFKLETPQGIWQPRNYSEEFFGPVPMRTGIEKSRNLMTVRLAQAVGMDTIARYAEDFNIYPKLDPFLANALGSQETTLFNLVAAYAMFANGGERLKPTLVDRIQDRYGKTIFKHDARTCTNCDALDLANGRAPTIISDRKRVLDPVTAYQLTSMLEGVVKRGTARYSVNLPVPVAGKTGTTNDAKDVWFIGFSSRIVAGCYIGFDQPKTLGRRATGGGLCAPVFNDFMQKAIETYGGSDFTVPQGGHFVKVDRFSGQRVVDDTVDDTADDTKADNIILEFFHNNRDTLFGKAPIDTMQQSANSIALGHDLPVFNTTSEQSENPNAQAQQSPPPAPPLIEQQNKTNLPSLGSLSSGGQY